LLLLKVPFYPPPSLDPHMSSQGSSYFEKSAWGWTIKGQGPRAKGKGKINERERERERKKKGEGRGKKSRERGGAKKKKKTTEFPSHIPSCPLPSNSIPIPSHLIWQEVSESVSQSPSCELVHAINVFFGVEGGDFVVIYKNIKNHACMPYIYNRERRKKTR
jgi:hypothetical protein